MVKLTIHIDAHFSDELLRDDLEGIKEDCEDVVRGFGGHGVVITSEEVPE